jgi:hypothetical protein
LSVELILSLNVFVDFINTSLNMATSRMGTKSKTLPISENLNITNKVDGVFSVPRTKIAEELGIPVRKVTDKMFGWSDTGENVLRLLQDTQV